MTVPASVNYCPEPGWARPQNRPGR
jgi:hypothetical protein